MVEIIMVEWNDRMEW